MSLFFSMQIIYYAFLKFRTVRSFILSFSAHCSAYFSSSLSFSCQLCLFWDICGLEDCSFHKGPEVAAFLKWAKWFRYMTLIWDFYFLTKTVTTIAHCSLPGVFFCSRGLLRLASIVLRGPRQGRWDTGKAPAQNWPHSQPLFNEFTQWQQKSLGWDVNLMVITHPPENSGLWL